MHTTIFHTDHIQYRSTNCIIHMEPVTHMTSITRKTNEILAKQARVCHLFHREDCIRSTFCLFSRVAQGGHGEQKWTLGTLFTDRAAGWSRANIRLGTWKTCVTPAQSVSASLTRGPNTEPYVDFLPVEMLSACVGGIHRNNLCCPSIGPI